MNLTLLKLIQNKYLVAGGVIILLIIGWFYLSSLNSKIELLESQKTALENNIRQIVRKHKKEIENLNIKLENQKKTFEEKEKVIDSQSKLKEEIVKRGEVKDEDNFIRFAF